jgi:penicillin-binding protein 2
LTGYLGEIDEQELDDSFWSTRKSGDVIGKMGLEKILDEKIRGRDGGTVVEVDSLGRLKRVIREYPYQVPLESFLWVALHSSDRKKLTSRNFN